MKKLSELMLEGYAMVGEKQTRGVFCRGNSKNPRSVCALGAANLAKNRDADYFPTSHYALVGEFERLVGISITKLNDGGMSIPDIAGIAAAEGL